MHAHVGEPSPLVSAKKRVLAIKVGQQAMPTLGKKTASGNSGELECDGVPDPVLPVSPEPKMLPALVERSPPDPACDTDDDGVPDPVLRIVSEPEILPAVTEPMPPSPLPPTEAPPPDAAPPDPDAVEPLLPLLELDPETLCDNDPWDEALCDDELCDGPLADPEPDDDGSALLDEPDAELLEPALLWVPDELPDRALIPFIEPLPSELPPLLLLPDPDRLFDPDEDCDEEEDFDDPDPEDLEHVEPPLDAELLELTLLPKLENRVD